MPLPLSPAVEAVVRGGVRALGEGCAARAGLSRAAQLVELSAMIAHPGAEAQRAHTDVPPATRRAGATLWVALQDVELAMGPIAVHAASPARVAASLDWAALAARAHAAAAFGKTFSPDGEPALEGELEGADEPSLSELGVAEPPLAERSLQPV